MSATKAILIMRSLSAKHSAGCFTWILFVGFSKYRNGESSCKHRPHFVVLVTVYPQYTY